MPTYEYRCKDCGRHFDVLYRSLSAAQEAAPPPCPECGSANSQRVLSPFSVSGGASTGDAAATGDSATRTSPASITPKSLIDTWRNNKAR